MTGRKRVAILISGRGSNMSALIEAAKAPDYPAEIVGVFSNTRRRRRSCHRRSRRHPDRRPLAQGLPSREAFDDAHRAASSRAGAPTSSASPASCASSRAGFVDRWTGPDAQHPPLAAAAATRASTRTAGARRRRHRARLHRPLGHPRPRRGPRHPAAPRPVLPGDTADTLAARILIEEHKVYPQALAMVARGETRFSASGSA